MLHTLHAPEKPTCSKSYVYQGLLGSSLGGALRLPRRRWNPEPSWKLLNPKSPRTKLPKHAKWTKICRPNMAANIPQT